MKNTSGESSTEELVEQPYKYGFITEIEEEKIPKGIDEDVIRLISAKKEEPEFMLEFRLKAYQQWLSQDEPDWAKLGYPKIDYQYIIYYAAPKTKEKKRSLFSFVSHNDGTCVHGARGRRASGVRLSSVFAVAGTHRVRVGFPGCWDLLRFYTKLC